MAADPAATFILRPITGLHGHRRRTAAAGLGPPWRPHVTEQDSLLVIRDALMEVAAAATSILRPIPELPGYGGGTRAAGPGKRLHPHLTERSSLRSNNPGIFIPLLAPELPGYGGRTPESEVGPLWGPHLTERDSLRLKLVAIYTFRLIRG